MANRLLGEFGGNLEDAKIIATEMAGIDSTIGIGETKEFWKTFVLRKQHPLVVLETIGGYTLSGSFQTGMVAWQNEKWRFQSRIRSSS